MVFKFAECLLLFSIFIKFINLGIFPRVKDLRNGSFQARCNTIEYMRPWKLLKPGWAKPNPQGSFRTGSTGSWEPVNFGKSYAKYKNLEKTNREFQQFLENAKFRNPSI